MVSLPGGSSGEPSGRLIPLDFKKGLDAVIAGAAIHVAEIVLPVSKFLEWLGLARGAGLEIFIKHSLPSHRVDGSGLGDDAVHVEDRGIEIAWGMSVCLVGPVIMEAP